MMESMETLVWFGALMGAVGGVLKSVVVGSMEARLITFGAVGGVLCSSCLEPLAAYDLQLDTVVLLGLCGYLAADLCEAQMVRSR